MQKCRCRVQVKVQRFSTVGCAGAEVVQRWCRGGTEVVQRCRVAELQRYTSSRGAPVEHK
jgi:hypothetical protein